ncbi:MAG: hypothetical protein QM757_09255 [Paludibaculum sp.]
MVVAVCYGPETWRSRHARRLNEVVKKDTAIGYALRVGGRYLHLPAHPFFLGLNEMALHQKAGHPSYMLGSVRQHGTWNYFPFVFLVKTPLGALLLCALALPLLRRFRRDLVVLAVPLGVYWALCLTSGINIGVRHLLPVFPFTYALVAVLITRHAVEVYRKAAPALARRGLSGARGRVRLYRAPRHRVLQRGGGADRRTGRNCCWIRISIGGRIWGICGAGWMPGDGMTVCLAYFGSADDRYYRFQGWAVAANFNLRTGERPPCHFAAISVTLLEGVYHERSWYAWLRARQPMARIGWSIYVYDVADVSEGKVPKESF